MAENEFTGTEDKTIIKMILANKAESERNINDNFREDWKSFYENYRCISQGKPREWMSDEFMPMTHSHVETALANIMAIIFSVTPPVQIKPREKSDNESATVMEQLITYDFQVSDFYMKFMDFVKSLLIYGTAIGKVTWRLIEKKRKFKVPDMQPNFQAFGVGIGNKQVGWKGEDKIIAEYDDPYFENCNLLDIFVDPQSLDIQDSWVIHRVYRNKNYLKSKMDQGIYNDEVNNLIAEIEKSDESVQGQENQSGSVTKDKDITRAKGTERIELLEWWGDYDIKGDGELRHCLFTLAGNKYLIRKDENPYWHGKNPFIKGVYIPLPNEFYGIGIAEILYGIQHTVNETVNQRIDNISLILNRMFIYKKQTGVDVDKLLSQPGGIMGADELNAIVPQLTPDVTASAYRETSELERWAQEADAVTKITMGTVGAGTADTLGGMQIQQATAGNRFMLYNKIIENLAFIRIVKMFYELNHQYLDQNKVIRIVGEMGMKYATVKPEDILKEYDFIPAGVLGMENRNEKALKLIQFKSISKDDTSVKIKKINEKILQFMGFPDVTEYIRTDAEMADEMARQFAMRQMESQFQTRMQVAGKIQQAMANRPAGSGNGAAPTNAMVAGGANVQPPGVPPVGTPVPPGQQSTVNI